MSCVLLCAVLIIISCSQANASESCGTHNYYDLQSAWGVPILGGVSGVNSAVV